MPQEVLARLILLASDYTNGKRLRGQRQPGTRWRDYISNLAWSHLGVEPLKTLRYFESS